MHWILPGLWMDVGAAVASELLQVTGLGMNRYSLMLPFRIRKAVCLTGFGSIQHRCFRKRLVSEQAPAEILPDG
ncbi:hypothetical protein AAFF_G00045070 [Aldrovandia affinis]|uniref:Uncharacterized protein n=1 Tax=Aldrovandia affinis TaxID=143900 RepID=A0AAD7WEW8_9TELE|nr:hypothetical protein AAFF_G00045070 [Aldrovandia affinis]